MMKLKDRVLKPTEPGFVATMPGPYKYGLAGLPNPRISEQPSYVRTFAPSTGGATMGQGQEFLAGGEGVSVDAWEGAVAIVFDLAQSIDAQIEGWREFLKSEQQRRHGKVIARQRQPKKKMPDLWLRYLRALDAKECGASLKGIADAVIVENEKTVATPQSARAILELAQALQFNFPT